MHNEKRKMKTTARYTFCILHFTFLLLVGCNRGDHCRVPIGEANFTLQPNNAAYRGLNNVGGYEYFYGGHRGIVVVRTFLDEFVAYERTCPLDTNTQLFVSDTIGAAVLECPKCLSRFSTYSDGMPLDGSATSCCLYQYSTHYDGTNLTVY